MTLVLPEQELFDDTKHIRISNSQAASYDTCQKLYELAHIDNLQPKEKSEPLEKGNTGHKIIEVWAQGILDGKDSTTALQEGILAGMKYNHMLATKVIPLVTHWVQNEFPKLGWKILAVEKTFFVPVGTANDGRTLVFPFTVDLLIEAGGYIVVVDHKFTQDFYEPNIISMAPQLKRYVAGLRALGIRAHHGTYNFFRTRENMKNIPERLGQRDDRPNKDQIVEAFTSQVAKMKRIANHEGPYIRSAGSYTCKRCPMLKICVVETRGDDSTLLREMDYEKNTYTYNKDK